MKKASADPTIPGDDAELASGKRAKSVPEATALEEIEDWAARLNQLSSELSAIAGRLRQRGRKVVWLVSRRMMFRNLTELEGVRVLRDTELFRTRDDVDRYLAENERRRLERVEGKNPAESETPTRTPRKKKKASK